jgi:hypothetical protein
MLNLFDEPVLPGLRTRPDIINRDEEAMLIERIDATDPTRFKWVGRASVSPHHSAGPMTSRGASGCC